MENLWGSEKVKGLMLPLLSMVKRMLKRAYIYPVNTKEQRLIWVISRVCR
ncbi:hypothetical protein swp_2962 [Shewanella piezotolerans WP3]|uniref:Uncharacterized protein n=1 Tax=Shewanella piezotolerans (strain WP3 / JCM 13877) TaxID=225849 RepID=B8CR11_SHEPW|nr:hypothetical protein swp_2962 [Shewanella piezotolerans WP3]